MKLIIVSSLPLDWKIPEGYKESFVREIIGEAIPPMLSKKIVEQVTINNWGGKYTLWKTENLLFLLANEPYKLYNVHNEVLNMMHKNTNVQDLSMLL